MIFVKEDKGVNIGLQQDNFEYRQSANTLFNFMPKLEYLLDNLRQMKMYPRYVEENVEFLNLTYGNRKIRKVAFPMLCFCDINLHKLSLHVEGDVGKKTDGYGKYGVGLDKKWCELHGFQPISYLNPISKQTTDFSKIINVGLKSLYDNSEMNEQYFDYILEQLALSKPLTGKMLKEKIEIQKNFHDEKEWRFLPNLDDVPIPSFLNDATMPDYMTWRAKDMSDALRAEPQTHLNISIEAIKYIFVDTIDDREELLNLLKENFKIEEALILASKIIIYNQIVGDW